MPLQETMQGGNGHAREGWSNQDGHVLDRDGSTRVGIMLLKPPLRSDGEQKTIACSTKPLKEISETKHGPNCKTIPTNDSE